ncbi:hypothetical protein EJ110_NYTH10954 [Nymphaea thermarum]|nr:hypothetical protein EJ110_NYTH10954 [Nymphaea thermarum]
MSGLVNMLESDSPIIPTPQQPHLVFSHSGNSMTSKHDSSSSGSTKILKTMGNSRQWRFIGLGQARVGPTGHTQ